MGLHHSTNKSFFYAFSGIKTAFKNEPNLRIHLFIGFGAIILAIFLNFTLTEWILLVFTIYFVIVLELINTVLESVVDLVSPEIQPKAKIAKDVSAAVVLIAAGTAIIVGALLFVPKILSLLS